MSADLSIFAARLSDHLAIWAEEFSTDAPDSNPALLAHTDAEFNGLALMLFTLQFQHNPAYQKICAARKVSPDDLAHWTGIPTVPTSAFKELELTCLPPAERTHVFHSSGTTAQRPSRHFHHAESLAIYEASLWPWLGQNLRFTIGDLRLLSLTPPAGQVPHSSLAHMLETVRQKLGAPPAAFVGTLAADQTWTLDFDATQAALREATSADQPLLLLGTAFSFVHLLDFLAEKNLRFQLPPGSRVMETGGYKNRSRTLPKAELHALITDRLGIPPAQILCEYGMSELSSQAYDSALERRLEAADSPPCAGSETGAPPASRVFHFPPWARAQIISPETGRAVAEGETGLLRIFDLANVFSVMAVQTEDLAIRRGDGFELLGRAELSEPRGCSLMTVDSQIVNRKSQIP